MKKILYFLVMAIMALAIVGCGNSKAADSTPAAPTAQSAPAANHKVLVAYFSWGGKTRGFAEEIARQSGADLFEIVPATPYPTAYKQTTEIAKAERANNARPQLAGKVTNMEQYDTIIIGYPIWWHDTPKVIDSFMESYDLKSKTVVPFATSGGSGIEESLPTMRKLAKDAKLEEGILITTRAQIPSWLNKLGLTK